MASHLSAAAAGTPEPAADVAQLSSVFPGYGALVEELDTSPLTHDLAGVEDRDPLAFESRLAPAAKRACERAASQMR